MSLESWAPCGYSDALEALQAGRQVETRCAVDAPWRQVRLDERGVVVYVPCGLHVLIRVGRQWRREPMCYRGD